jgi:uncharacterized OsmC-like protein
MEVTVGHVAGLQFECAARGHRILSDQPRELGGDDKGMTPPELLLAALGACAGYYAGEYLRVRSLSIAGLAVRVTAEKATQPARLGALHIDVEAPAAREERYREGLVRAVKKCLIHNTLLHPPEIEVSVAGAGAVVS